MKIQINKFLIALIALVYSVQLASLAQTKISTNTGDSLSLNQIISEVIKSHPSVQQAAEALNAADAKIDLAKSGYLPNVNFEASYDRLGPASSLAFPGLGKFELYPLNNYNASINVQQTVYDFGKTSKNINIEKENKVLAEQTLEQVKQKLAMSATINFYSLLYLQEAIRIKDEQLHTLKEHLDYIEKKKETGSATSYEILTTKVKISTVESQKIDLIAALNIQLAVLNNLLGTPENTPHVVKTELTTVLSNIPTDSLSKYAMNHRDEMQIAKEKTTIAQLRYKMIKTQYNPVINLMAVGGEKNGFFPDLNKMTANYVAGIDLKIPIFDASRTKFNLRQANSYIQSSNFETEITRRTITNEVMENEANRLAALKKVKQFELQLTQAQQALALATISFKAGSITNLDLLDASTSVSESRLYLLKSKIDYMLSVYKLKMTLGQKLY